MNNKIIISSITLLIYALLVIYIINDYKKLITSTEFIKISSTKIDTQKIIWQKSLNFELFDKYIKPKSINLKPQNSQLNINILGILYSNSNKNSQVLLDLPHKKIYHVGDELSDKINIVAIKSHGIIINNHGIVEILNLPKTIA